MPRTSHPLPILSYLNPRYFPIGSFGSEFDKPYPLYSLIEHVTELKEPGIVGGYFALNLKHVGTQHHYLPDWDLVSNHVAVLVLSA